MTTIGKKPSKHCEHPKDRIRQCPSFVKREAEVAAAAAAAAALTPITFTFLRPCVMTLKN